MPLRRQRLALLLVVALTALTLSAAFDGADGSTSGRGSVGGDDAFAVRGALVDGTLARLSGDERRDSMNSERTHKQRLVGFAVPTSLLSAAYLARRRLVVDGATSPPATTWWSPHTGRSPPSSFSSSIA